MCLCIFTSGKVQKSANIIIINEKLISAIYNNSSRLVECEEFYIRSSHNKNRIFCLFLINHAFSFSLRAHIPFISLSPFLHEDPQHETYSSTYMGIHTYLIFIYAIYHVWTHKFEIWILVFLSQNIIEMCHFNFTVRFVWLWDIIIV